MRVLALFVGLTAFYTIFSGWLVLSEPDEARCALIARHMLATGDWLAPQLLGRPYFDKPPLFFWMIAASESVFGENEWAVRLAPAVSAAGTVVLTGLLAWQLFGATAGWLAGLTFAVSVGGVVSGRIVRMDMLLALWTTAALVCLARAYLLNRSRGWYLLAYLCMALGCLTKGPVAVVLPGLIVAVHLIWTRRPLDILRMRPLAGIAIVVPIFGSWVAYMAWRYPAFLREFFYRQHLDRYAGSGVDAQQPWWILPASVALFALPWVVPVAMAAWQRRPRAGMPSAETFLWAWGIVAFALFLPSKSKLPNYVLPMLPSTFALLGLYLAGAARHRRQVGWAIAGTYGMVLAGLAAWPVIERLWLRHLTDHPTSGALTLIASIGGFVATVVAAGVALRLHRDRPAWTIAPLTVVCGIMGLLMLYGPGRVQFEYRSSAGLAAMLAQYEPPAEPVVIAASPRYGVVWYAPPGWTFEVIDASGRDKASRALLFRQVERLAAIREPVMAILTGDALYDLLAGVVQLQGRLTRLGEHRKGILVQVAPAAQPTP